MLSTTRSRLTALCAAGVVSLGAAAPASAAVDQDGLVNVNVQNVTAQVPVGVAANVCDIAANVLAQQLALGETECDATATTIASNGPGNGGNTRQQGLVNVNAEDIVVQVPVAIAANVCDVSVGVLSRALQLGESECDATADAIATN